MFIADIIATGCWTRQVYSAPATKQEHETKEVRRSPQCLRVPLHDAPLPCYTTPTTTHEIIAELVALRSAMQFNLSSAPLQYL